MRIRTLLAAASVSFALAAAPLPAAAGDVIGFIFEIDGSQEVPPVATAGVGTGVVSIDTTTNQLSWYIVYSGLTGPAMAAHFHGPAPKGVNAGVKVDLGPSLASPIKGSTTISEANKNELLDGMWYVNIHTAMFGGGEIRGQTVKPQATPSLKVFQFTMDGQQEVPPNNSPGTGTALVTLDTSTNRLSWVLTHKDLVAPAGSAHFHGPAPKGVNAGIFQDIGGVSGVASPMLGTATITAANAQHILDGMAYVNIHTSTFPGGEIRGQVENPCYPDCDGNGQLNIDDFICFQLEFALQTSYADCDGNQVHNIDDFICFQLAFALGC